MVDKISDYLWEIKKDESLGMRVPVRIYANKAIISTMQKDRTLKQATNATSLPGIVKNMLVLPDGHEGYGSPIGGVAAFDSEDGIISPGFVGYDINCSVRVIKTNMTEGEVRPKLSTLMDKMFKNVPSGVGSVMKLGFTINDLDNVSTQGMEYVIGKGFGIAEDAERSEESGCMEGADPKRVSDLAKQRGVQQLGTMGAGNHFAEVQKVDKILDKKIAKTYGLEDGQVVIMLHSGSRGFGHQICSDYLRICSAWQKDNGITMSDPELVYAKIGSKEADEYLAAMKCAVNFAFCNHEIMTHFIRKSFEETFGKSFDALGMELLYHLSHNIAKLEEHIVDGKRVKLYVHRKGATRAFGPGRKEVTKLYRDAGQPVLIPGSMGTASYILAGREESMLETFGSSCHGAGRIMSRHQALREIPSSKTMSTMEKKAIEIRVRDRKLVSEEAEWAYKDVDSVVESIVGAKISNAVARLVPLGVAKG